MESHMKLEHRDEYYKIRLKNGNSFSEFLSRKKVGKSLFTYVGKNGTEKTSSGKDGQECNSQMDANHKVGMNSSSNHSEKDPKSNAETETFVSSETFQNTGDEERGVAPSVCQLDTPLFKCTVCPAVFTEPIESIRHMKSHIRDKPSDGPLFQEFLKKYKNKFRSPLKRHYDEKPFQCTKCRKCFHHLGLFNKHLMSAYTMHIKSNPMHMKSDGVHMKLNGKIKESNTQPMKSNSKQKKSPTNHRKPRTSGTKRKKGKPQYQLQCEECGKIFTSKFGFHLHRLKHAGIKPYECNVCEKRFSQKWTLKTHMGIHTGCLPHKCTFCNKGFALESILRAHIKCHNGEMYKCSVCNKELSGKSNLAVHMRIHTGEKPYQCSKCGRRFTQSCSLNNHFRLHTGDRPFQCSKCEKRFVVKDALTKHMRTHTGEKPFKCHLCGKAFSQSGSVKVHSMKHHK